MKQCLQGSLKNSLLLFFLLILHFHYAAAQPTAFAPAANDEQLLKNLLSKYENAYNETVARFPSTFKKDYKEIAQLRWSGIKALFQNGEIYTAAPAQAYLDALVNEIVSANPLLKEQPFDCYFSRSGVPNASYMGHGIIIFNMGLFWRLENESQAAFILCHEIAHFYLQHSENRMHEYVATLNSTGVQKELKQIKGSEFGKRERLDQLLKELTFDSRRHSRNHEREADSLAVVLMRQTRFDAAEALSVLSLLDNIDADALDMPKTLKNLFDAKSYPFKKRWIAKEEGLLGGHARIQEDAALADSLKTHPDCSSRIALLAPKVTLNAATAVLKKENSEAIFQALRRQFSYEVIEYAYNAKNYSKSLYYTIDLLQNNPADPYLVTQVGKILNGFYKAQKEHQLSKFADLPSPYFSASYNQLLQFVQNLYVEDYGAVSFNYLQPFHPQLQAYLPFAEVYRSSQQISQQ